MLNRIPPHGMTIPFLETLRFVIFREVSYDEVTDVPGAHLPPWPSGAEAVTLAAARPHGTL